MGDYLNIGNGMFYWLECNNSSVRIYCVTINYFLKHYLNRLLISTEMNYWNQVGFTKRVWNSCVYGVSVFQSQLRDFVDSESAWALVATLSGSIV